MHKLMGKNYHNQIIPSKTIKSHKLGVSNPSFSRSIHACTAHHDELLASTLCLPFTKLRTENCMPRAVETHALSFALIPWTTGWISSNFLTLLSKTMSNLPALVSKEALQGVKPLEPREREQKGLFLETTITSAILPLFLSFHYRSITFVRYVLDNYHMTITW